MRLNFRDGDGLCFANRNATLAAAAIAGIAHDGMAALDFVDFAWTNFHTFAAGLALCFVYDNNIHKNQGLNYDGFSQ
jgi:hypothetical protein